MLAFQKLSSSKRHPCRSLKLHSCMRTSFLLCKLSSCFCTTLKTRNLLKRLFFTSKQDPDQNDRCKCRDLPGSAFTLPPIPKSHSSGHLSQAAPTRISPLVFGEFLGRATCTYFILPNFVILAPMSLPRPVPSFTSKLDCRKQQRKKKNLHVRTHQLELREAGSSHSSRCSSGVFGTESALDKPYFVPCGMPLE